MIAPIAFVLLQYAAGTYSQGLAGSSLPSHIGTVVVVTVVAVFVVVVAVTVVAVVVVAAVVVVVLVVVVVVLAVLVRLVLAVLVTSQYPHMYAQFLRTKSTMNGWPPEPSLQNGSHTCLLLAHAETSGSTREQSTLTAVVAMAMVVAAVVAAAAAVVEAMVGAAVVVAASAPAQPRGRKTEFKNVPKHYHQVICIYMCIYI